MLSYQFGYSHIVIQGSGETGYIPTDNVAPAPAAAQSSPQSAAVRHRLGLSRAPTPEEESQVPLPAFPEAAPPAGSPPFRY